MFFNRHQSNQNHTRLLDRTRRVIAEQNPHRDSNPMLKYQGYRA